MKFHIYLFSLFTAVFILGCAPGESTESGNSQEETPDNQPDRNMFGSGIPRGLIVNAENTVPGYIMFTPSNSASTYLISRTGQVVHEWKGNYAVMGGYLQDDGSLIQNAVDPDFPVFAGGGQTGRLQKLSWDSKMVWDFEYANEEYHAHHDFAVMPNGNILAIAWESKSYDEAIAAGRKPELIPKAGVWPDKIVEIQPTDKSHADIVWEWHSWDHLIQNHDPTKANYGDPAVHPELLDINMGHELPEPISEDSMEVLRAQQRVRRNQTVDNRGSDIYHFNSINYHAELDQIVFGSPHLCEIFIIDHSTTTEEAAGHSGGRWGKGGDFLYRWGNPKNYHRGDSSHQKLWNQHDVRWIEAGKPGAGHLTVFNNDIPGRPDSMNYSAVYELVPPSDEIGNYFIEEEQPFGPEQPHWVYTADDTVSFWSSFISGAHRMANGGTFITEGAKGRFFEVTSDGEIVWEYVNPYRGNITLPNGDPKPLRPLTYYQFRGTFIPANHPGLAGKSLEPIDPQPEPFVLPAPPE